MAIAPALAPQVTLVSWSQYPLETLYHIWQISRVNDPIALPAELAYQRTRNAALDAEIRKLFLQILDAGIPVAENLTFTFILENISISLREQLVRHRIGVKVGDRLGVDFIPDLADSTWWAQSMRILDMGEFAAEGRYRMPQAVRDAGAGAEETFLEAMDAAQEFYQTLVQMGVPMEEARDVIPLAATHRLSWTLNLASIKHIVGKRGCWILQLGLWEPIIRGMIEAMATLVDPIFRTLIQPPCIVNNAFDRCHFSIDNERRIDNHDALPPCSLYMGKVAKRPWHPPSDRLSAAYAKMTMEYTKLWNRNAITGEAVNNG